MKKQSKKPEPTRKSINDDKIEEAGKESFPASDPPSWTLGEDKPKKKNNP